ncbi:MAG: S8 family peptidase [Candidatus Kapabacteria bacterium]|nr:S8 family peptidase [Candidatus Kapabacteria bacterium]
MKATDHWLNKEILKENTGLVRMDAVLSNICYIRFNEWQSEIEIQKALVAYNAHIVKRLLLPNEAYSNQPAINSIDNRDKELLKIRIDAESKLLRTYIVDFDGSSTPEQFCNNIKKNCALVEVAEPYYLQKLTGEFIPNDPMIDLQPMFKTIHAFEAWNIFQGDSSVTIGICDSGILQSQEDLRDNIQLNKKELPDNEIDDDGDGFIDNYSGYNFAWHDDTTKPGNTYCNISHGTAVAGLAAATTNNKIGVAGVGFKCHFFPLKVMLNYGTYIIYGYEAIMYCARHGFQVINCSWGGGEYSCVNETIIDYAFSLGSSVVAAAGNHGTTMPFYPAAYRYVLAAGVTNIKDEVVDMSARGHFVDIMTPGQDSYTTSDRDPYGGFCCTSGASPIASGAVALVRAQHPELNSIEANEIVRLSNDNIDTVNPKLKDLIPGRLNLYKCVTNNKNNLLAQIPISIDPISQDNKIIQRPTLGDTFALSLIFRTVFNPKTNVKIKISTINDSSNCIQIIDSVLSVNYSGNLTVDNFRGFRLTKVKENKYPVLLKFQISAPDGSSDKILFPLLPTPDFTKFENSKLAFTAIDNGRLGYSDPPNDNLGSGFYLKEYCNLLNEGGLIATVDDGRVVHCVRNASYNYNNDFLPIKNFDGKDINIGTFSDSNANQWNRIGLEFQESVLIDKDSAFVAVELQAKNISNTKLSKLSLGYFLDWDIGLNADSNRITLFDEGIPETKNRYNSIAALVSRKGNYPLIGCLVTSKEYPLQPQLAGILASDTYSDNGFDSSKKFLYLNSGSKFISNAETDMTMLLGMRFPRDIMPMEELKFKICLCSSYSVESIKKMLKNCVDSTFVTVSDNIKKDSVLIFPNPANSFVNIFTGNETPLSVSLIDLFGEEIELQSISSQNESIKYNLSNIPSSVYVLLIKYQTNLKTKMIVINR